MTEKDHPENSNARPPIWFQVVFTTGRVLTLLVIAVTVGGFFARYHWRLDLMTHFPVQLAVGALFPFALLVCLRKWSFAMLAGATLVVNGLSLIPFVWPVSVSESTGPTLRVVSSNVYTGNPDTDSVMKFIRDTDPDIIVVMEIDDRWREAIRELEADYPHNVLRPRADNFGIGMLSRIPIRSFRVEALDQAMLPTIVAEAEFNGGPLHIIGTHPLPPMSERNSDLRNEHLEALANRVVEIDGPVIVVGDLNTTSWSPYFRNLIQRSGLRDSRKGRGIQATWPGPNWLFQIPIDHALVTDDLVVTDRYVGPDVGSDHRPIVVEVGMAKQ